MASLPLGWNRLGYDKFGLAQKDLVRFYSLTRIFYRHYFRVQVSGIGHIPSVGRAMLVGNHSGGVALDAWMTLASCLLEKSPPRLAHAMADKFLGRLPFASSMSPKVGLLNGLPQHATALLEDDRVVLVFPEGTRGTAKLHQDQHSLVRFGTGFLRLALKTQTPIIPFAFRGGGDAIPTIANLHRLGRLFGVPYVPVTPYLLPIPKPASLEIRYGAPMSFEGSGNENDSTVERWVGQVRDRIADLLRESPQAKPS